MLEKTINTSDYLSYGFQGIMIILMTISLYFQLKQHKVASDA
jgi:Ca2+/H+ antiporter